MASRDILRQKEHSKKTLKHLCHSTKTQRLFSSMIINRMNESQRSDRDGTSGRRKQWRFHIRIQKDTTGEQKSLEIYYNGKVIRRPRSRPKLSGKSCLRNNRVWCR